MHDGLEDRLLRDWQGCGPLVGDELESVVARVNDLGFDEGRRFTARNAEIL